MNRQNFFVLLFLPGIFNFGFITCLLAQNLSIPETISYLNTQFSSCPEYTTIKTITTNYYTIHSSIKVNEFGEIIIREEYKGSDSFITFTSFNPRDINVNKIINYPCPTNEVIPLICKKNDKCIKSWADYSKEKNAKYEEYSAFGWGKNCNNSNQICNALLYLIQEVKSSETFKQRLIKSPDPFDKPYEKRSIFVETEEGREWEHTKKKNNISSYRNFLQIHPNSKYVSIAKKKIIDLEVDEIMKGDFGILPKMTNTSINNYYSKTVNILITNGTPYNLTIRYSGEISKKVSLSAGQTRTIYLTEGNYRVAASVKYFALINSVNFRKWIFSIDFL